MVLVKSATGKDSRSCIHRERGVNYARHPMVAGRVGKLDFKPRAITIEADEAHFAVLDSLSRG